MQLFALNHELSETGKCRNRMSCREQVTGRSQPPAGIWRGAAEGLLLLLLCGALLAPACARAQEFRGTISGAVTDPSGAVVPGAKVEVLEVRTGTISRTVSDNAGQYVVPFLLPGDYSITAAAPGFQTLKRSGITLAAQGHLVLNLALSLGNESQMVIVTGESPLLNTADASVGEVISAGAVANLPLNGRAPEMLAELAAGVMPTNAPTYLVTESDVGNENAWSMGGTPSGSTESLLDGAPDEESSGGTTYSPTQDTVREITVRPFDTDASYGHTIGGVVNMVTKNGTNALHGTAYEFSQIPNLDANLYFNDRAVPAVPTPVFHFNQFGLTAGGPVLIPKIYNGKNKLFFFFAWEGEKKSSPNATLDTVPTDAEKEGDFSAMLAGGKSYQLYEPNTGTLSGGKFTRTAVPNNCLTNLSTYCSSVANAGIKIDPVALAYLKLFPEPNDSSGVSPITNEDNFLASAPGHLNYTSEFGRLDYNLSSRDHVFFDFRHSLRGNSKGNDFGNNSTGTDEGRQDWGVLLDNVFTLNPTTVFDVRLNSMVFEQYQYQLSTNLPPTSVGFPSYMDSASEFKVLPQIKFTTYTEFSKDSNSSAQTSTNYQIFADMMKMIGRHTLKIGLDARQIRERAITYGDSSGAFAIKNSFVNSGTGAAKQPCCADLAEFEYGLSDSGDYQLQALGDFRSYYVASFIQDDWRVSNHLTLNLGLRYDVDTPWGEKFGRTVSGFSPSAVNSASGPAAAAFAPSSVTVNDTTLAVNSIDPLGGLTFPVPNWGAPYLIKNNAGFWSPRIGFSYNPARFNKTVVRGGFGLFVAPQGLGGSNGNEYINQEGFSSTTPYTPSINSYYTYYSLLDNPFPAGITPPAGSSAGASTFLGQALTFLAPVQHDQYSERWTLGVQQSLSQNMLVGVLYEGNHAVHLGVSNNINATELQYLNFNPWLNQNLVTARATAVANPFYNQFPGVTNGPTAALSSLTVPYPAYGSITEEDMTIGQSFFESGMVHFQERARHGLMLMANYQYSKTIEQDSYLNPEDTKLYRGISPNLDHPQHFTVGGTYDLPFGRGKQFTMGGGTLVNEIAGGWVLNAMYQYQTGLPIDFTGDIPFQPGMTYKDIKSQPRQASATTPALNTSIFVTGSNTCVVSASQPCDGTVFFNGQYANHYRTLPEAIGSVRQDGANNLDASILKNFALRRDGSAYFQLRFETFDTLNHPLFGTPDLTPTDSTFGYITSVFNNSEPRQVQLGGRIVF